MFDGSLDERVHAVFQHLGDEGVRRTYHELAPCFLKGRLVRYAIGVLEPGLEGGTGNLQLQLS